MRLFVSALICLASAGPLVHAARFEQYILAPSSRTLQPRSIHAVNGTVVDADSLLESSSGARGATFVGNSSVTYDYEANIGGVVTLTFGSSRQESRCVGLTFTESSLWISGVVSDSTSDNGDDEPLWLCAKDADSNGVISVDSDHQRGAFR